MNIQIPDNLDQLPTDKTQPTHEEMRIINTLFKENNSSAGKLFIEFRPLVILAILFIIVSLPQVEDFIKKLPIHIPNNSYVMLILKALILVFAYYFINNMYLVRN